jgi:lipopolysaccharide export system permease protein
MEKGSIHLQPREEHSYTVMSFETGLLNLDINQALLKRSGAAGRDVDGTDSLALLTTLKQARRSGQPAKAAEMEIHKRFSASYACLLFGLVGAPLGIRRSRSGKSAGIAVAIGVTLVYYLILAAGTNLAEKGTLSPAAAYWLPNGLVTLAALLLVVKKGREVSFGVVDRLIVFSRRLLSRRRGPA